MSLHFCVAAEGAPMVVEHDALIHQMHAAAVREVIELLDGLFVNLEDALFEEAYRVDDGEALARDCFETMRTLRQHKAALTRRCALVLERFKDGWTKPIGWRTGDEGERAELATLEVEAEDLGARVDDHFSVLLDDIAEASMTRGARLMARSDLPIAPKQVAMSFLVALRTIEVPSRCRRLLMVLFERFVLTRLGSVLGAFNTVLRDSVEVTGHIVATGPAGSDGVSVA